MQSGPKSVIINGHNGWMHNDLKTAVLNCLDINPKNCRQYALTYTWEASTDQILNNLAYATLPYAVGGQLVKKAA